MGFYEAMGWKVNWRAEDDSLAELELTGNRMYLRNYYNKAWGAAISYCTSRWTMGEGGESMPRG